MPPSQETKECPCCAEIILAKAIKCRHCGEMLDGLPVSVPDDVEDDTPRRLWSPGVAALLSVVIPGAGQMYRGKVGAGLLWLVCVSLGYIFIVPGVILHVVCIINAASGNPVVDGRESAGVAAWFAAAALSLACVAGAIIYLALYQNPGNRQFDQQPLAFVPPSPTPPLDGEDQDATPTPSPSVDPNAGLSVEASVEAESESLSTSLSAESVIGMTTAVASNLPQPSESANPIPVTDTLQSSAPSTSEPGKTSRDKTSAQQRYQAGVALLKQQRWAEAEAELREAVRLKAGNPYYHFHLGAALSPQMRFIETEAEFREASRLDPSNALWHAKLGYILSVRKKWAEAEQEAREAARLDPSNVGYRTLLQNIQQKK
ncbi:MAG: hypothetical protein WCF57_07345 [Pyrinomonadaceae bacterium]